MAEPMAIKQNHMLLRLSHVILMAAIILMIPYCAGLLIHKLFPRIFIYGPNSIDIYLIGVAGICCLLIVGMVTAAIAAYIITGEDIFSKKK
jgi:hypothetical protein